MLDNPLWQPFSTIYKRTQWSAKPNLRSKTTVLQYLQNYSSSSVGHLQRTVVVSRIVDVQCWAVLFVVRSVKESVRWSSSETCIFWFVGTSSEDATWQWVVYSSAVYVGEPGSPCSSSGRFSPILGEILWGLLELGRLQVSWQLHGHGWRRGIVVSGIRRINEVHSRWTRARIPSRCVTSQIGQLSLACLRGRLIEYRLWLGKGRECHLCRVAGNTVWSHMACEFPQWWGILWTAIVCLPCLYLYRCLLCHPIINVESLNDAQNTYLASAFPHLQTDFWYNWCCFLMSVLWCQYDTRMLTHNMSYIINRINVCSTKNSFHFLRTRFPWVLQSPEKWRRKTFRPVEVLKLAVGPEKLAC